MRNDDLESAFAIRRGSVTESSAVSVEELFLEFHLCYLIVLNGLVLFVESN